MMEVLSDEFIEMCYNEFKERDKMFPKEWTLEEYKIYAEECNRILEEDNEDHI